jgi:hypothetical protein
MEGVSRVVLLWRRVSAILHGTEEGCPGTFSQSKVVLFPCEKRRDGVAPKGTNSVSVCELRMRFFERGDAERKRCLQRIWELL